MPLLPARPRRSLPRSPVPTMRLPGGEAGSQVRHVCESHSLMSGRARRAVACFGPANATRGGCLMDNVLFALYGWFSLALLFVGCVGSIGGAPPRVSLLRMVLVCALHVALSLALSAHIAWRRLHWVPVEGESIATSQEESRSYPPPPYRSSGCGWCWTYGGVTYTAEDYIPFNIPDKYCCVSGKRTTVWVDPRDPSRLLPPSWRDRLFLYLFFGGMSAYMALRLGALTL